MKVLLLISNRQTSSVVHKNQTPVTLTKCGGKYLMEYLLTELLLFTEDDIDELVFITSPGISRYHEVLKQIATKFGLKTNIYTCLKDNSPLEALDCAKEALKGPVLILPANAWFKGGITLNTEGENMIVVKKVEDPSINNVVKIELNNSVSGFYDKSLEYVSDLSPVDCYFFKKGQDLIPDIQKLIKKQQKNDEQFKLQQLISHRIKNGDRFLPINVESWVTCVHSEDLLEIHHKIIAGFATHKHIADSAKILNSVIVSPVFIGEGATISNSVVGPNVSIGEQTKIENTLIENSIIADNVAIKNVRLTNSIFGTHAVYAGKEKHVNLGEYSYLKE